MSKQSNAVISTTAAPAIASAAAKPMAFSFGDPESVLDRRELLGYFELWRNDRWYEPPLPMAKLSQAFNMSPHHRSAIALKVNLMMRDFVPSRWLGAADFERFATDFLQMGNGYLEKVPNLAGTLLALKHSPAIWTRAGVKAGVYYFVKSETGYVVQPHEFKEGSIVHIQQPDVAQEIYGLPEWLSALQSGLLNENATLFRRRYYLNGAHAGFVFYLNEALASQEDADAIKKKLESAKGVGNFKNMFVYMPGGKKDGVQILPIADVTAKDEFSNIKNISRDDLLAAHRVPPQLIGIIPQNNGGFGDVGKAMDVFHAIEIEALWRRFEAMNDEIGVQAIQRRPYVPVTAPVAA